MMTNCNTEQLNKQKEYLKNEIINGTNKDYFKVIDLECGTGKSVTTNEVLATFGQEDGLRKKVLLVKQRIEDSMLDAKKINELAGKTIALTMNTDVKNYLKSQKFEEVEKQLYKVPIVVITHQKYKALAKDKAKRKLYTQDREIIIVDEFLNIMSGSEVSITLKELNETEALFFDREIKKAYSKATQELYEFMINNKEKQNFYLFEGDYKSKEKQVDKVISLIKANLNDSFFKSISKSRSDIYKAINKIKNFYKQSCVVEHDYLHCVDLDYDYWLLDNNIMLDATARVNKAYNLNSIFKVQSQTRVLDHSNWFFTFITANTTSSGKKRAINLYETINMFLSENLDSVTPSESTLYVGNKEDEDKVIAIYKNHFGNVTGSNKYRDLKDVVIGHTPNAPYRQYVLEYIFHSKKQFKSDENWSGNNKKDIVNIEKVWQPPFSGVYEIDEKEAFYRNIYETTYRFNNDEFEEYRVCKNVEQMYQAIKRINRNMEQEATVTVFCSDSRIIGKLCSMFKTKHKINFKHSNIVEYEKRTYTKTEKVESYQEQRKENSYATKFIYLCQDLLNNERKELLKKSNVEGVYSKKKIVELLECNSKDASKLIFNNTDVIKFSEENNIEIKGQTICLNKLH